MIGVRLLGRTPLGGEVYALSSDRQYEIPAVRIFVSMGKPIRELAPRDVRDVLEFIELLNSGLVDAKGYVRRILAYHHGDIGEFGSEAIYLRGVSRLLTFLAWIPVGALRGVQGVGTERSLRYVTHRAGFVLGDGLIEESYEAYISLRVSKVPKEDARYLLPLATRTEVIMQVPVGRELSKWAQYMAEQPFDEAQAVGRLVSEWNRREHGFEMPGVGRLSQRFPLRVSEESPRRAELERLLGGRIAYYDPITETLIMRRRASISSMHQDVRNRRVIFYWPSWERVVDEGEYLIPPVRSDARGVFDRVMGGLIERARELWEAGDPNAIYYLPMGTLITTYSLIHGNNSIYGTIRLRTCMRAQWEIRNHYWQVLKQIRDRFPGRLGPMCITNLVCYEPDKEKCPLYKGLMLKIGRSQQRQSHPKPTKP